MERHEIEAEAQKMLEKLRAIFILAGIDVKTFHRLPNGYVGDQSCPHIPWALAETKYGLITIGWRKRVIHIGWPKDAGIHGKTVKSKEEDWITDWEEGVHAYGYAKAVEYLTSFREKAEQLIYDREADARLTAEELREYRRLSAIEKLSTEETRSYEVLFNKRRTKLPAQG
jgi:hypothetical protein